MRESVGTKPLSFDYPRVVPATLKDAFAPGEAFILFALARAGDETIERDGESVTLRRAALTVATTDDSDSRFVVYSLAGAIVAMCDEISGDGKAAGDADDLPAVVCWVERKTKRGRRATVLVPLERFEPRTADGV